MKVNNKLATLGLTAAVGFSSLAGVGVASAHYGSGDSDITAKIAEKFGISQDEVQAVFDEEKTANEAERAAERSEQLQELVDSGEITSEQKTLIEEKQSELEVQRDEARAALDSWAEENGIDLKYVRQAGHGNEDRLASAVEDGDITDEQKTLIEAKLQELEDQREASREELKQWVEDNDVEQRLLMNGGRHGNKGGSSRR